MSTAYTPGLTVTDHALIRKSRRLPLKGDVLVNVGDSVQPHTIVARTQLPGPLTNVRAAQLLGLEPGEIREKLCVAVGATVEKGELLGEVRSFFGLFSSRCEAPVAGTVEFISDITGNVGIRHAPKPIELTAYIPGEIVEVLPGEGAVVETRGALVQGIFGVGGERHGAIKTLAASPHEVVPAEKINAECAGRVLVFGGQITYEALETAARVQAVAVVGGSIADNDLRQLLGYDIGVATTGRERLPFSLIITEGFGTVPMAARTFDLLQSLEGKAASVNGATQIRAGVIRPEIIVALSPVNQSADVSAPETDIEIGSIIRLIREPFFGVLAEVCELPVEPQRIETGAVVRVLKASLPDGNVITVPRANVEIVATKGAAQGS